MEGGKNGIRVGARTSPCAEFPPHSPTLSPPLRWKGALGTSMRPGIFDGELPFNEFIQQDFLATRDGGADGGGGLQT